MAGLNLGADFNAALVNLAGWDQNAVDASTLSIAFLNQGGQTTIRATATANVDTDALNALIREYIPAPPEPSPVDPTTTDTEVPEATTDEPAA
ncbi:hypothetical protein [Curtobacterium sp. MCBA15_012]|uniref:hypothetical protein n=1 Tax=Curtobacterium sp. MCBA15_012 TaxID=1898738 RepID=UPI000911833A|nr:hypothetical protein [Curtobacterium sp. MCBA15_012]WIA99729.1 hypothetical protein QOL15_14640 [Curtobacterium sp. MCBA15_012]